MGSADLNKYTGCGKRSQTVEKVRMMFTHIKRLSVCKEALEGREVSFAPREGHLHLGDSAVEDAAVKLIQDLGFIDQRELPEDLQGGGPCPTEDLLKAYYFAQVEDEEIQRLVKEHLTQCDDCLAILEAIDRDYKQAEAIAAQIPSVVDEMLKWGRGEALSPLLKVLKKVARSYLKESLIEPLFRNLQELSPSKKTQIIQRGLVPGLAAVRGKKSAKRKEFEKMLKSLLPEETDLNALIQQGDKQKLQLRLSQLLDDEQVVEEIMTHL